MLVENKTVGVSTESKDSFEILMHNSSLKYIGRECSTNRVMEILGVTAPLVQWISVLESQG